MAIQHDCKTYSECPCPGSSPSQMQSRLVGVADTLGGPAQNQSQPDTITARSPLNPAGTGHSCPGWQRCPSRTVSSPRRQPLVGQAKESPGATNVKLGSKAVTSLPQASRVHLKGPCVTRRSHFEEAELTNNGLTTFHSPKKLQAR